MLCWMATLHLFTLLFTAQASREERAGKQISCSREDIEKIRAKMDDITAQNESLLSPLGSPLLTEDCSPDGSVWMTGAPAKPAVKSNATHWMAICYTDELARALGVNMQGFDLESKMAKEEDERINADYGEGEKPVCEPDEDKPNKSSRRTLDRKPASFKDVFDTYDANKDGVIDVPEAVRFAHEVAARKQKRLAQAFPFVFQYFVMKTMANVMAQAGPLIVERAMSPEEFEKMLRKITSGELSFYVDDGASSANESRDHDKVVHKHGTDETGAKRTASQQKSAKDQGFLNRKTTSGGQAVDVQVNVKVNIS